MKNVYQLLVPFLFIGFTTVGQNLYNPNILPLGDKEALMGNAGTGGFGSTGAVFYNPGALTNVDGNSLSLSGSAYLRFTFKAKPLEVIGNTPLNYEANGFQTIPTSVIIVRKLKNWHVGFSALVPMSFSYEGHKVWNVDNNGDQLNIKFNQNYAESNFLVGLSAARRINDTWSAGISLYGQNYSYLSTLDFRSEVVGNPDLIFYQSHRESFSPVSLLVVLGLQKQFNKINVGFRAMLPSIHMFGKADYYDYSYENFGGPSNIQTTQIDVSDEGVKFKSPLDLRVGGSFFPTDKIQATLDLSYRFALEYNIFDDHQIEESIDMVGNYRINSGIQYKYSDALAFNGGFSYVPTTLNPESTDVGMDFISLFIGGKSISKYFETSLGLFYSLGHGQGNLSDSKTITDQRQEYMGVVLCTNYRF